MVKNKSTGIGSSVCPITRIPVDEINDPTITIHQNTYDKAALVEWFTMRFLEDERNRLAPRDVATRVPLKKFFLPYHFSLRGLSKVLTVGLSSLMALCYIVYLTLYQDSSNSVTLTIPGDNGCNFELESRLIHFYGFFFILFSFVGIHDLYKDSGILTQEQMTRHVAGWLEGIAKEQAEQNCADDEADSQLRYTH